MDFAEERRHLTAFMAYKGLFKVTRAGFGLASAGLALHRMIGCVLRRTPGNIPYSDYVLAFGRTSNQYDAYLKRVLNRLNLTDKG